MLVIDLWLALYIDLGPIWFSFVPKIGLLITPWFRFRPRPNHRQWAALARAVASRGSPAPGGQCLHRRPPPPWHPPPFGKTKPFGPGPKIGKQQKMKRSSTRKRKERPPNAYSRNAGPLIARPLKISPYTTWAGAPSEACPGGHGPPAPPPRYATDHRSILDRHLSYYMGVMREGEAEILSAW